MNRRQKIIVSVTGIFLVLLLLVGLTYAYFLTRINGNENTKTISVSTANLALVYGNDDGSVIGEGETIVPGTTFEPKTFTVTNQGNANTDYVVVIENTSVTYATTVEVDGETHTAGDTTTFESNDFVYTLTCTSGCNGVNTATTFPIEGGILVGNRIDVGETQTYSFTLTYKETGVDQSNDMNKTLEAKINIKDITTINPYSDNINTLAYNIINNAIIGATGTTLSAVPETTPAVSISGTTGTGKYELATDFLGWDGITYGSTQEEADYGENEITEETDIENCNSVIEKYITDQNYGIQLGRVIDCDTDGKPYLEINDYEKVLTITQDDLGTSYYYRGAVEDNYVNFNNMCWRIVRIEGDGAVKLILEDKDNTCETVDGNWVIGTGHYGYDFYNPSETGSGLHQKNIADYVSSPEKNSTSMKVLFDEWLASSGIDTNKLKKDKWCLGNTTDIYDRSTGTLLTDNKDDLMYNDKAFLYEAEKRLYGKGITPYATLMCDGKNDKTHESYIGTLTADEAIFAGASMLGSGYNSNYYLVNEYFLSDEALEWRTLTIGSFNGFGEYSIEVWGMGIIASDAMSNDQSLRPSLTLAKNILITGGNGTKTNPYVVG